MTKKDYIILADQFRRAFENLANYNPAATPEFKEVARELVREGITQAMHCVIRGLHDDNPRFSAEHFADVCLGRKGLQSRPARQRKVRLCDIPGMERGE